MWPEENSSPEPVSPAAGDSSSSKQLERFKVSSGKVLVIDQFMLGNLQFIAGLPLNDKPLDPRLWCAQHSSEIRHLAMRYGGSLLELSPGEWSVLRDPLESLFVLSPTQAEEDPHLEFAREATLEARGNITPIARVFIDTRCLVFVDAEILGDTDFLASFRELRQSQEDKVARDALRERGAAVRYGFNREGDELGVFRIADGAHYALWPDVVAPVVSTGAGF